MNQRSESNRNDTSNNRNSQPNKRRSPIGISLGVALAVGGIVASATYITRVNIEQSTRATKITDEAVSQIEHDGFRTEYGSVDVEAGKVDLTLELGSYTLLATASVAYKKIKGQQAVANIANYNFVGTIGASYEYSEVRGGGFGSGEECAAEVTGGRRVSYTFQNFKGLANQLDGNPATGLSNESFQQMASYDYSASVGGVC
jgi:hypothetical protein